MASLAQHIEEMGHPHTHRGSGCVVLARRLAPNLDPVVSLAKASIG